MGKRVIIECDLTKQEYDPDGTVTLVLKRAGKKAGRTYELSPDAAAKLEQQLVAGPEAKLPVDWKFIGASVSESHPRARPKRTLEDLENEPEDDSSFVAAKKAELKEAGVIQETPREEPAEIVVSEALGAPKGSKCPHLNKGRVQTTLKGGKRFAFRTCKECRAKIPMATVEEKEAFMNGKLDSDVRMRDL